MQSKTTQTYRARPTHARRERVCPNLHYTDQARPIRRSAASPPASAVREHLSSALGPFSRIETVRFVLDDDEVLDHLCALVGYVVTVVEPSGLVIAGVVVACDRRVVVLERWDARLGGPSGVFAAVALSDISAVTVW